jgi:hypothetical protein
MWQHVGCKDDSTPGQFPVGKEMSAIETFVPQIYE